MVARAFFLGSLLLGAISASPVAVSAPVAEVPAIRSVSTPAAHKIDTMALWAREWFGAPELAAVSVDERSLDANTVIDKVSGWAKDWYHTDESVAKRDLDTDDVVDTVASWTKEWLHEDAPQERAVQATESVDETIDRFAGKLKNFLSGEGLSARSAGFSWDGIIGTVFGWLENLDWNDIVKTVMGWLQDVDWNSIIKGILSWVDSTFFGGSSSSTKVAARDSGIDWSSIVQKVLTWAESLL